jgi:hypothetical protein
MGVAERQIGAVTVIDVNGNLTLGATADTLRALAEGYYHRTTKAYRHHVSRA